MRQDQSNNDNANRQNEINNRSSEVRKNPPEMRKSSLSPSRGRTASLETRAQADQDIINYITNSQSAMDQDGLHHSMVRSNSYTIQDIEKQRQSIQASVEAGLEDDDPTYRFFHSNAANLRGRRYSKSLPELQHLRNFPLMATHYIGETAVADGSDGLEVGDDEEDDEEAGFTVKTVWAAKSEFIFTGISLALGLNNIWRFPYFCYKFNGGSFLIAYLISLIFFGLPILSMEYALGQLTRRGPIAAFGSLVPLLKGVSVAASFIALILAPMYSTINSWSLFYFFKSFYSSPLWSKCGNSWNSLHCMNGSPALSPPFSASSKDFSDTNSSYIDHTYEEEGLNETTGALMNSRVARDKSSSIDLILNANSSHLMINEDDYVVLNKTYNSTLHNRSITDILHVSGLKYPTQEFFDEKLLELEISESFWGNIQWELIIFVFVTWLVVFVTLRKNILFSSHPSSCISIIPFAILGVFFARALMMEGAREGIIYFFQPDWNHIRNPELWLYSAGICLHSLGCILGISFAKATCNRERNNFLRDAFIICFINAATVIFIGTIVFATIGHLAFKRDLPIPSVLVHDAGLAFIAFSELLSSIPFTPFWSVIFFLTLFCVGVDYQISMIRSFFVAIEDAYGSYVKKNFLAHQIFALIICLISFLVSLVFLTRKGIMLIEIVDQYVTVIFTLILAFFEMILIGWFYGGSNLSQVIKLKISKALGCFFPFCWNLTTPFAILAILTWNACNFREQKFRETIPIPMLMQFVVVGIVIAFLMLIPIIGYRQIMRTPPSNIILRIVNACKPLEKEARNRASVHDLEIEAVIASRKASAAINNIAAQKVNSVPVDNNFLSPARTGGILGSRAPSRSNSKCGSRQTLLFPNERITLSMIQGLDRETDL